MPYASKEAAAVAIQSQYRGHRSRKAVQASKASVSRLQATFRAKATRSKYENALKTLEKQEAEFQAARQRQRRLQTYNKEFEILSTAPAQNLGAIQNLRQQRAARTIQRGYRLKSGKEAPTVSRPARTAVTVVSRKLTLLSSAGGSSHVSPGLPSDGFEPSITKVIATKLTDAPLLPDVLANPHIAIPYVTKDPGALLSGKSALSAAVRCFDHVLPPRPVTTAEGRSVLPPAQSVRRPWHIVFLNAQPVDVRSTACPLPWASSSRDSSDSNDYISRLVDDVRTELKSGKANTFGFPNITASDVWTAVASRGLSDPSGHVNGVVLPVTVPSGEGGPPDPWQSGRVPGGTFNPSVLFPAPADDLLDAQSWKGDQKARVDQICSHMETQIAAAKVRGRWRSEEVAKAATSVQRVYRGHLGRLSVNARRHEIQAEIAAAEALRVAQLCQECVERKAVLLCQSCADVNRFCPQCWTHVHSTNRRKGHEAVPLQILQQ